MAPRVQLLSEAECAGLRGSGEVAAGEVLRKLLQDSLAYYGAGLEGPVAETVVALPDAADIVAPQHDVTHV